MTTAEGSRACPPLSQCGLVELRQYTFTAAGRAPFVDLFEESLVEPQEEGGMRVAGTFLDDADPGRFVWFRGFADRAARLRGLEDFYLGPLWPRYRDAVNRHLLDSDDVLLLAPVDPPHPPAEPAQPRAAAGSEPSRDVVRVTVLEHDDPDLSPWLAAELHPVLERALGGPVAAWRSADVPNDFPRLPVRDARAYVWAVTWADREAADAADGRLADDPAWRERVIPRLADTGARLRDLTLRPTARSQHPAPHPVTRVEGATR